MSIFDEPVGPKLVLSWLQDHDGATMLELKTHFKTSSKQMRKSLGVLMANDKVFPMGAPKHGVYWMTVTGKKGRPSPMNARAQWKGVGDDPLIPLRAKQKASRKKVEAEPEDRIEEMKRKARELGYTPN